MVNLERKGKKEKTKKLGKRKETEQRAGLVCVRQECGEGGREAREAGQGCAPPLWNAL